MPSTGYKSITVHEKQYKDFKAIAGQKCMSITLLMEYLIEQYSRPYVRAMIDEIADRALPDKKGDFKIPYLDFVLDSKIKHYESTAWVRSKNYIKEVGGPMWVIEDRVRHDDEFAVERMFILSEKSWNEKEVWKWVAEWLIFYFLREKQFRIFVLKERDAEKILAAKEKDNYRKKTMYQYYDMGIYGEGPDKETPEIVVGYLEIDAQSKPGSYRRFSSIYYRVEVERAQRYFEELKKCAQQLKNVGDLERLEKEAYHN